MSSDTKRGPQGEPSAKGAPRKPYAAPKLRAYGAVAKLTQGLASAGNDLGGMSKNTMCL